MNKLQEKESYLVPKVHVVEFKVELGHTLSGTTTLSASGPQNGSSEPKAASNFGSGYLDWNN